MKSPPIYLSLSLIAVIAILFAPTAHAGGSRVTISKGPDGNFTLLRDGQPFFMNGVGGTQHLDLLKKLGGNSVRTWGIESLEEKVDGKPLIKRAEELGLGVVAGIWVQHERHGFNYSDEAALKEQREKVRAAVRQYKNEPALLVWGLGNEMEGPMSDGKDSRIWKELNVLAGIIKQEDPNHPVMTVIAGAAATKVKGILKDFPNIDILGVNAYAGASGAGKAVYEAGWKKPFALTEFGPVGHWEVPKTSWGAPIEPSSWDKAATYYAAQELVSDDSKGLCVGTFAFLWGQKQEVTETWYGMFLRSGEKLPSVDAMARAWNGKWPEQRSPKIESLISPLKESTIAPGASSTASVQAKDANGDPLQIAWDVIAESTDRQVGGDAEAVPPTLPECIVSVNGNEVSLRAPTKPGAYRLFVTVRDGNGGASKDNFPFLVK